MNTESTMSILLIEDDAIDAESVRRSLPRHTNLFHTSTLHDALRVLHQVDLDLILLDPGLPDSSGVDSFLCIRQSAPKLPIVVLTGLHDKELALQIIRLGAQDYLLKDQLDQRSIQALQFAVERGRLLQQLEDEQAERERLSAELREQEQSLAHLGRVALMGELVAEISHEVSQPLTVISTLTAALEAVHQQHDLDRVQCRVLIRKLADANAHAGDILQRLREFIRNDSIEFELFDINELIVSTTEFVDFERRRREIDIRHDFSQKHLLAFGNKTQIRQVVVNLLRNAFDAMQPALSPNREVTVKTFQENGTLVVEVIDRGTGLQLDLASTFAAFKTTKADGLGMGLAICARIINNHKGKLCVVPSSQPGSTFRFELPCP
jgi:C4-dicarboxylate-specific signal transduction histidine kinase